MTKLSGTPRRLDSGFRRNPQDPVSTKQRATRHQGIGRPLVGILLAAGKSERFGGNKLLHALPDGQPIALVAARNMLSACDRILVVLRPGDERLAELFSADGFEVLICHDADSGMGHSLAAGIRASRDAGAWIVALGDMPYIRSGSHLAVASRLRAGDSLVATSFLGQRGHPVGFSRKWFKPLAALTGDNGAKAFLAAHSNELNLVALDDPGVVCDIDRPEDLKPGDYLESTRQ